MDIHQNARTTPHSRAGLVRRVNAGESPRQSQRAWAYVTRRCASGRGGFPAKARRDWSTAASHPHRLRCPTAPEVAEQVIALRRQRLLMKHIAAQLETQHRHREPAAQAGRTVAAERVGTRRCSSSATSIPRPVTCCTSTPRSSAASTGSARA